MNATEQVKNSFPFEVNSFRLSGPDNMQTDHYGLFRSDTGECVGRACKRNYMPHTTDDVVSLVDAASNAFGEIGKVNCYFNNGHIVSIAPNKAERAIIYKEDGVFPRVFIRGGYDGKGFRATLGFYRDLCKNLSIMQMVEGTTVSIRHNSNLRKHMNELIAKFNLLKDGWDSFHETMVTLNGIELDIAATLDKIYGPPGESKKAVTMHKNRTEAIVRRIMSERAILGLSNQGQATAWQFFNGVQGYAQWDSSRHGKQTDFSRAVLATEDQFVKKTQSLVLEMAA